MKTIAEALAEMLPSFTARAPVRAALEQALGQFCATPISARYDQPAFDNSAMDGYAVRAAELASAELGAPVELPLRLEARAGAPAAEAMSPGTTMRIFTGAPLPEGADSVVAQEDVVVQADRVRFSTPPERGQHVRVRAGDAAAGALILERGAELGPGEIGLLASQGHASVAVHRRPRVAILSTGDELREVGEPLTPGTIVNSNAYALAAQVQEAGGIPWVLPISPDRLESIEATLRDALEADLVLTSGGVSVGDYDFVHEAFSRCGVQARFWKVRIKPGKPLAFGLADRIPVVGLPGNPVSAMVTFEVFVRPGIRKMLGDPRPHPVGVSVRSASSYRRRTGRTELVRARLRRSEDGLVATFLGLQGSGSLLSMVGVDALVVIPPEQAEVRPGDPLESILLRDRLTDAVSPF